MDINITQLIANRRYLIFDGAFGTMLQKYGLKPGENPTLMNITAPESVEKVHRMYVEAGSDIICANTFCANAHSLANTGYTAGQVVTEAVKIARRAAGDNALVALDLGSTGQLLEPAGELTFDEAYDMFKELAVAGESAGADLAAIETMSDPEELRAAMTAISDNTKLPIFATMTFEPSGFTFMGCTPEKFAQTAESLGAVAIGLNCSLEPRQMYDIAARLTQAGKLPLIIKPNAGLPDAQTGSYNVGPDEFAEQMLPYKELNVKIVGGCCGTTPEHIKVLKKLFAEA